MYNRHNDGWIEVITGCMYAGKTEEFIRRIGRLLVANTKILIFKPSIDVRYHETSIVSHRGLNIPAIVINKDEPEIILEILKEAENKEVSAVAIDELQFFNEKIIKLIGELADNKIQVILAGLDLDFRGEPFPVMSEILARAEFVTKLNAVCIICHLAATRTQRITDGKPAHYNSQTIMVGAQDKYEARCRKHHVVPH